MQWARPGAETPRETVTQRVDPTIQNSETTTHAQHIHTMQPRGDTVTVAQLRERKRAEREQERHERMVAEEDRYYTDTVPVIGGRTEYGVEIDFFNPSNVLRAPPIVRERRTVGPQVGGALDRAEFIARLPAIRATADGVQGLKALHECIGEPNTSCSYVHARDIRPEWFPEGGLGIAAAWSKNVVVSALYLFWKGVLMPSPDMPAVFLAALADGVRDSFLFPVPVVTSFKVASGQRNLMVVKEGMCIPFSEGQHVCRVQGYKDAGEVLHEITPKSADSPAGTHCSFGSTLWLRHLGVPVYDTRHPRKKARAGGAPLLPDMPVDGYFDLGRTLALVQAEPRPFGRNRQERTAEEARLATRAEIGRQKARDRQDLASEAVWNLWTNKVYPILCSLIDTIDAPSAETRDPLVVAFLRGPQEAAVVYHFFYVQCVQSFVKVNRGRLQYAARLAQEKAVALQAQKPAGAAPVQVSLSEFIKCDPRLPLLHVNVPVTGPREPAVETAVATTRRKVVGSRTSSSTRGADTKPEARPVTPAPPTRTRARSSRSSRHAEGAEDVGRGRGARRPNYAADMVAKTPGGVLVPSCERYAFKMDVFSRNAGVLGRPQPKWSAAHNAWVCAPCKNPHTSVPYAYREFTPPGEAEKELLRKTAKTAKVTREFQNTRGLVVRDGIRVVPVGAPSGSSAASPRRPPPLRAMEAGDVGTLFRRSTAMLVAPVRDVAIEMARVASEHDVASTLVQGDAGGEDMAEE